MRPPLEFLEDKYDDGNVEDEDEEMECKCVCEEVE